MSHIKYEAKPIECWQRAREIREAYNRRAYGPRESGQILVGMFGNHFAAVLSGLGSWEYMSLGQLGVQIACNRDLALRCFKAWEDQGYARDMCSDARINCGAMLIGESPYGAFPKPDFYFQLVGMCESASIGATMASEIQGVPLFTVDYPLRTGEEPTPAHIDFMVAQLNDAIEWAAKLTHREYRDDLLIEAVKNEVRSTSLWARIWLLNRAVPAPLSQRQMSSLSFPVLVLQYTREAVDFCELLLDEVKDRVQRGIASLPTERCRLMHEGLQPYYFPGLFEYVKRFGALFVASRYDLVMGSSGFLERADGSWAVAPTLEEKGIELRNRDDALRALVERYLTSRSIRNLWGLARADELLMAVKDWHIDGVVMHQDRGCVRLTGGLAECKRALGDRGIPNMLYEANSRDPREFSEHDLINHIDSFMESLGLSMIDA